MLDELGALSKDEKKVLLIFSFAALAWMFRKLINLIPGFELLTDAGVALIAALLFFYHSLLHA